MRQRRQTRGSGLAIRLLFGLAIAVFSLISYFASSQYNDVTGEDQHISLTPDQEIRLGLQSKPELIRQFGGLDSDARAQEAVDDIGWRLVNQSLAADTPWQFDFHVVADREIVNAFALPGGQVFISRALLDRLEYDNEVAGVLAHEIAHVLARHSAQRIAKAELTNGLVGAVAVASGDASAAQTAALIGQLVNMKYGRDDEIQSDTLGVCLMIDAEYDPNGMLEVMRVLREASGGQAPPEFFSTHPDPENRLEQIGEAIENAPQDCPD